MSLRQQSRERSMEKEEDAQTVRWFSTPNQGHEAITNVWISVTELEKENENMNAARVLGELKLLYECIFYYIDGVKTHQMSGDAFVSTLKNQIVLLYREGFIKPTLQKYAPLIIGLNPLKKQMAIKRYPAPVTEMLLLAVAVCEMIATAQESSSEIANTSSAHDLTLIWQLEDILGNDHFLEGLRADLNYCFIEALLLYEHDDATNATASAPAAEMDQT